MIVHTPAIVCRSVDFQESSKIVTLFTEEQGKLAVMARGVKKPKSKFSGLIEPAHLLDVVYYYKESRSVQILSEASLLEKTINLRTDFRKMAVATSAIELVTQVVHEEEVNKPVFRFARTFLGWLNDTDHPPKKIFPYLQMRLADLLGFGLRLENRDHEDPDTWYLSIDSARVAPDADSSYAYRLTPNQFNYISLALQARSARLLEVPFDNAELKELVQHMDRYFKYHVEGFRERTSDTIFEQILQE